MQKIITDPLYIKCKKVFESCKTNEQVNTAIKYYKLAAKRNKPKFWICDLDYVFEYDRLWDILLREVKWK